MKTKILAMLFLVLTIVFIVTACGDSTGTGNNNTSNTNNSSNEDNSNEHVHSWIEATCMSPKTCNSCGQTQGTVIAHSWSEATCVSAKICSYCGIENGSVSATNHDYGDWQVVKELSCTTNGLEKRVCSWCQNEETQELTAQGHNFVSGICENCKEIEPVEFAGCVFGDRDDHEEWWFGAKNTNGEFVAVNAELTLEITNDGATVYKKIFNITTNDFEEMTRSSGDVELRAKFLVYKDDIAKGINDTGKYKFTAKFENDPSNAYTQTFTHAVPQLVTTVVLPSLPTAISNRGWDGYVDQIIRVTDITYVAKGDDLYLYFSGEKRSDSEGDTYSRSSKIGYKLYDSEGYTVASGTVYITALAVGDKFKDEEEIIWNKITQGETYTLEILDVE